MSKFLKVYRGSTVILTLSVLGIFYGYFFPSYVDFLKPLGNLFIQLIRMLLIPIIFITVLNAVINIKSESKLARLSILTFCFFFLNMFVAALVGIVVALAFMPGYGVSDIPIELLTLDESMKAAVSGKPANFWDFVFNLIPTNILKAALEGNLLSLVFFTVFFAIALLNLKGHNKDGIITGVSVLNDALMWMIDKIMYLAPIAVFSLMAYLVGTMGVDILLLVGKLIANVIVVDFIWVYGVLAVLVALFTKTSYFKFVKSIIPVQLMAFSTSSSLVTLPTNLKACENMGLKKHIAGFMLPLGATVNMAGSALFYCIVTVFFAQMFFIDLTPTDYLLMALVATLGAMATPGVPGLSLTIVMVITVVNVPIVGLPLIFAADRILDMFTTTVNTVANTAGVAIMDSLEDKAKNKS